MDMEKLAKQALDGKNTAALEALAKSSAGEKLASQIDGKALEKAVRAGDMTALSAMLKDALSTPEGQSFIGQVKKAADSHGR